MGWRAAREADCGRWAASDDAARCAEMPADGRPRTTGPRGEDELEMQRCDARRGRCTGSTTSGTSASTCDTPRTSRSPHARRACVRGTSARRSRAATTRPELARSRSEECTHEESERNGARRPHGERVDAHVENTRPRVRSDRGPRAHGCVLARVRVRVRRRLAARGVPERRTHARRGRAQRRTRVCDE